MSSLQKAIKFINSTMEKEKKAGYDGACIELDKYNLTKDEVDTLMDLYKSYKDVWYYGDERYIRDGCELYHNINKAFVGKTLSICWK